MLVTGDREAAEGTVSVRSRSGGDLGARPVSGFVADALDEINRKDSGPKAAVAEAQSA
jgi:threonyl-tRNA synthetase